MPYREPFGLTASYIFRFPLIMLGLDARGSIALLEDSPEFPRSWKARLQQFCLDNSGLLFMTASQGVYSIQEASIKQMSKLDPKLSTLEVNNQALLPR